MCNNLQPCLPHCICACMQALGIIYTQHFQGLCVGLPCALPNKWYFYTHMNRPNIRQLSLVEEEAGAIKSGTGVISDWSRCELRTLSLYLSQTSLKTDFFGGSTPDLADVTVYLNFSLFQSGFLDGELCTSVQSLCTTLTG